MDTTGNDNDHPHSWFRANFWWLLVLCLSFAAVTAYYHHYFYVSGPNSVAVSIDHQNVIQRKAEAPMQYRFAPYLIAEIVLDLLVKSGAPNDSRTLLISYLLIRILAMTMCYLALLKFLSIWFDLKLSLLGLGFMVAVNPMFEFQYYHQPGDPWNLLFFILGFSAIALKKDNWLFLIIFLGVPFRESIVLLIPAYFAARYGELPIGPLILRTIGLIIVWAIPWIGIRALFGPVINYMENKLELRDLPNIFAYNLKYPEGWLVLFLSFNVLWFTLFKAWVQIPVVIRRCFVIVPIFLIIHLAWGRLVEGRLYMPLEPLFIVGGLTYLASLNKTATTRLKKWCKIKSRA